MGDASGSTPVEGKSADAGWTSRMPGFIVRAGHRRKRRRRPGSLSMVRSDPPTGSEVVDVAVTGRLDHFQRKHRWAGFPLAVAYKYFDDFGAYLAALLTYYGFVSLFPLLLLLSTVLGFVLSGDQRLQHEVLTSALHQFPLIGGDLARPKHLGGGTIGLVVGILGCLYGGVGVAPAVQYATNTVWGVPRNNRPNPFHARGRSLVLLATTGLAVMGTTVLAILGGGGVGA